MNTFSTKGTYFIQISDTHIGPDQEYVSHGLNTATRLKAVVASILALPRKPDFVVHTGDALDDPLPGALEYFDSLVDPLRQAGIPVVVLPGNHDPYQEILSLNRDRLEGGLLRFQTDTFEVLGIPSIVDPENRLAGRVRLELMESIERVLSGEGMPLVVCNHYPFLNSGCPSVDELLIQTDGMQLHSLLRSSSRKVLGVFHGHLHSSFTTVSDGICYFSAPSVAKKHVRIIDLTERREEESFPSAYNEVFANGTSLICRQVSIPLQES